MLRYRIDADGVVVVDRKDEANRMIDSMIDMLWEEAEENSRKLLAEEENKNTTQSCG